MNYRFKPHKMNEAAQVKANNMKVQASILLDEIEAIPDCREKNVAIERLGDVLDSSPIDLTRKGKCTGCGECCSNILPLSDAEIKRIKEYIKLNNVKEQSHFIIGMATKPEMDLSCPFMMMTGNKRCVIYDIRPEICRDYVCNKSRKDMSEELRKEKRKPVFMRETFFGKEKK